MLYHIMYEKVMTFVPCRTEVFYHATYADEELAYSTASYLNDVCPEEEFYFVITDEEAEENGIYIPLRSRASY